MGLIRPFAPREREILECLLEGMRTKEIACALGLAPRTVDNRIAGICDKAGLSTRAELIIWAIRGEQKAA
jgi:DNA-binding CsgD family transcriptional regulator